MAGGARVCFRGYFREFQKPPDRRPNVAAPPNFSLALRPSSFSFLVLSFLEIACFLHTGDGRRACPEKAAAAPEKKGPIQATIQRGLNT